MQMILLLLKISSPKQQSACLSWTWTYFIVIQCATNEHRTKFVSGAQRRIKI